MLKKKDNKKNTIIENCIFNDVPCAIGNHTMASEVERKDKNGKVIAKGKHDKLMTSCEYYRTLYQTEDNSN